MDLENSSLSTVSEENNQTKILSPLVRDALISIINTLRPVEFLKLSSACKGLRAVCLHSPGVSIECRLTIRVNKKDKKLVHDFEALGSLGQECIPWVRMHKLISFPFYFVIDAIYYLHNVSAASVKKTKKFLRKIRVKKVSHLAVFASKAAWNELVVMARDYQIEQVSVEEAITEYEQLKKLMGMRMRGFTYSRSAVDDEDLTNVNIPTLNIKAVFAKETAQKIIQRWLERDLVIGEWLIESSAFTRSDLQSIFRRFPTIFCDSYTGPLLDVRPLVIVKEDQGEDYFFIVRDDGLVMNVYLDHGFPFFTTEYNFSHAPEILMQLLY